MPLHMQPIDISDDIADAKSALIVSCPICPPISLAMQKNSPVIELFKRGLKTGAFEDYIQAIREPLEQRGVRVGTFRTYLPSPTMCLWTTGQRGRLRRRAKNYDTVIVLGCDTARYTVEQALEDDDCNVVQAMWATGMTNAALKFEFPATIRLENKVRVGKGNDIERIA